MAKDDSIPAEEKLIALLIGAGIGAMLALLFAPKSGRELRGDIADYTKRGVDAAGEQARVIAERATQLYGSAAGKASEVYGTAAGTISETYGTARERRAGIEASRVHGAGEGPDEGYESGRVHGGGEGQGEGQEA